MTVDTSDLLKSKRSVLVRAFDILECFTGTEQEQTITGLCDRTGLPPATIHRMLSNLIERGVVERADRGRYRLGHKLWMLGNEVPTSRQLKYSARPYLVDLHGLTSQIAVLATPYAGRIVVVDVIAGRKALAGWAQPRALPIGDTAPGLAVAAHLAFDEASRLLGRPPSFALRQQLAQIRQVGVASAPYEGMTWLSAPVLDGFGLARSTVSCVVPTGRTNLSALARVVSSTAAAVTKGLREPVDSAIA